MDRRRLLWILVGLNILWAPVNLFVRVASTGGFSPLAIAVCRWTTLGVLLTVLAQFSWYRTLTRFRWPSRADSIRCLLIGICLFGPAHAMYYFALTKGASIVGGSVLNATAPIWTAALAFLILKEKISPARVLAILIGFSGAYIVVAGFGSPKFGGETNGNLVYLAAVLMECLGGVMAAQLIKRSSGMGVLTVEVLGSTLALAGIAVIKPSGMDFQLNSPTLAGVASVGYLILVSGLVCFGVWYSLVESAPLSLMVVTLLLQPPLAALSAWLALGEVPTAQVCFGSLFVISGLIIAAMEPASARLGTLSEKVPTD